MHQSRHFALQKRRRDAFYGCHQSLVGMPKRSTCHGAVTSSEFLYDMKIDAFIRQQNIERYRKLLTIASDEMRRQIQNLLEEELQNVLESKRSENALLSDV